MTLVDVVPAAGADAGRAAPARRRGRGRAREHPIARAVAAAAAERRAGALPAVDGLRQHQGPRRRGRRRRARGRRRAGRLAAPSWASALPPSARRRGRAGRGRRAHRRRRRLGRRRRAACSSSPTRSSRPAPRRSRELRGLGLRPVLLTGDNAARRAAVAAEVGIDEVIAEVLPAGQGRRRRAAAGARAASSRWSATASTTPPRSAQADLGLAMGTGTDVAIEASDLTLVRGDLRAAADAIRLSRRTLATIKGNLFWAFAYNVAALPLAALGLLNPMIAGRGDGASRRCSWSRTACGCGASGRCPRRRAALTRRLTGLGRRSGGEGCSAAPASRPRAWARGRGVNRCSVWALPAGSVAAGGASAAPGGGSARRGPSRAAAA